MQTWMRCVNGHGLYLRIGLFASSATCSVMAGIPNYGYTVFCTLKYEVRGDMAGVPVKKDDARL